MIESRKSVPGYARNKAIAHFFGTPMLKGTYMKIEQEQLNPQTSALFYSHPNGEIWTGDAVPWLRSLEVLPLTLSSLTRLTTLKRLNGIPLNRKKST